ncbi:hypothetical protein E7X58_01705 [Streptomyces sp. A1499]|nr:hypothetical protein E7X58_01705 [Streptomyces sp. A1499]
MAGFGHPASRGAPAGLPAGRAGRTAVRAPRGSLAGGRPAGDLARPPGGAGARAGPDRGRRKSDGRADRTGSRVERRPTLAVQDRRRPVLAGVAAARRDAAGGGGHTARVLAYACAAAGLRVTDARAALAPEVPRRWVELPARLRH